jgi:hypothetical protein
MTILESRNQPPQPDQRHKLTPQTLQALVKALHADNALKAQVLEDLDSKGLSSVVERFFALSDPQKKLLDGHSNSPTQMQQLVRDAIRFALTTNGTIDLVHSRSDVERTSIGVSGSVGPGGVSGSISIEC